MSKIYIFMLCLALLALAACSENIFGGGSGGNSNCGNDIDCLIIEAEELFRTAKFEESYKIYEKIVSIDSTRSAGYYGMAKAGLWWNSVTLFNFIVMSRDNKDIGSGFDEYVAFFESKTVADQNRYLQGSKKAYKALKELNMRDSLTEEYYDLKNKKCKNGHANLCDGSGQQYPLSDMEYRRVSFNSGYFVSTFLSTILGSLFFDFWGEGCIHDEWPANPKEYGCDPPYEQKGPNINSFFSLDEDGMPQIDMEELYNQFFDKDGNVDQNFVDDINSRLDDLEDDLGELVDLLGSFINEDDESQNELKQQLDDYRGYSTFYKLNNFIDNDGDGCIDEELIYNGKSYDADGDGLYGEDSRIVSISENDWKICEAGTPYLNEMEPHKCFTPLHTNVDHNMNGNKDDYFIMYIDSELDTIIRVAWSLEPDFWASSYLELDNIGKNDLKKRIQIEKDKDGNTACLGLAARRELIGGCWKNYSQSDFAQYRQNPDQITKGGMNPDCVSVY